MARFTRRRILATAAVTGGLAAVGGVLALTGDGGDVAKPGRSRARSVAPDAHLPAQADVVVIGGGIIGATTAFFLAQQGVKVVLCEKGAIAGEASGRSQAQISMSGLEPFKLELVNLSKQLWNSMNAAVQGETGYRQSGLMYPLIEPEQRDKWTSWIKEAGPAAPAARILSRDEAAAFVKFSQPWLGAFYDPTEGSVEPTLAAPAIAEGARRYGAALLTQCAVRGVETSAGRVSHVVTERGTIRSSTVVLAGGCWSTLFAKNIGIRLPSLNVFTTQVRVADVAGGPSFNIHVPGASARKQPEGTYSLGATSGNIPITPSLVENAWHFRRLLVGSPWDIHLNLSRYFFDQLKAGSSWRLDEVSPFERNRILEPNTDPRLASQLLERLKEQLPAFATARVVETWGGALNVTSDNNPVISRVEQLPGLHIASGFSYGMTMAPAAGLLMSQIVMGQSPSVNMVPYAYSRFINGSEGQLTR